MKKMLIVISVLSCLFLVGNAFGQSIAGSKSDAVSDANSNSGALIDNSHQSSKNTNNDRKLIQGVPVMAGTNGFFTSPTPDSSFRSIKDILRAFGDGVTLKVTEGALENMAKGGDVDLHLQIIRGNEAVPRATFEDTKWLTIAIEKPILKDGRVVGTEKIHDLATTGLIDGEAGDAETNSVQVIGKCGLKVLKDGNTHMVITTEGAHRKVEASGWGIGTYTVYAGNWDNGKQGGGGGGGLGYATNETGPEDRPWIQGYVGVK
jgi:hypothetical protein